MFVQRFTITAAVNASGDATAYTTDPITGRIINIIYVPDGSNPYDNTADFVFTGDITGVAVLTKTNVSGAFTSAPRQATHGTDGAASLYAAAGTAVNDHIYLANERLKLVVAQGGNAKTGSFIVIVG